MPVPRKVVGHWLTHCKEISILDDFIRMATGASKPKNEKMLDGSGILKHILGGKQSGAIDMISQKSGLDSSSAGSLLSMLAPLVVGALGKGKLQMVLMQEV